MGDGIDDDGIVKFFEDDVEGEDDGLPLLSNGKRGASGVLRHQPADDLFAVNDLDRSAEDFLSAMGDFLLRNSSAMR